MLNFLLDIAPDKSQLLLTIKLAGILQKRNKRYTIPHLKPCFYACTI